MANVKRSATFGAIKLVRSQGSQVEISAVDIERNLAQRLYGVRVKEHAALAAEAADFFDRLKHPGFIVRCHDADQDRSAGKSIFELIKIDKAVIAHRKVGNLAADFFQMLAAIEHRLMLSNGGDNVIAFFAAAFRHTFQRQVIAFGCA